MAIWSVTGEKLHRGQRAVGLGRSGQAGRGEPGELVPGAVGSVRPALLAGPPDEALLLLQRLSLLALQDVGDIEVRQPGVHAADDVGQGQRQGHRVPGGAVGVEGAAELQADLGELVAPVDAAGPSPVVSVSMQAMGEVRREGTAGS